MDSSNPNNDASLPSELPPDQLDNAILVLVVDQEGNSHMWAKDTVDDQALAVHVTKLADHIGTGAYRSACAACAAGHTSHGH